MNEIIYLEPDEEITSVIDRLKASVQTGLVLVVPRGAMLAQSIVNLKLLKKSADALSKEISLVATDRITRNLASQLGLSVYSKVSEAERAKPHTVSESEGVKNNKDQSEESPTQFKVNKYNDGDESEDNEVIADDDSFEDKSLPENIKIQNTENRIQDTEYRKQDTENSRQDEGQTIIGKRNPTNLRGSRKTLFIVMGSLVIILLILSYLTLPYAAASLTVKTTDYEQEDEITVNKDAKSVDMAGGIIPGKLEESTKEVTNKFDATGKKDAGEKATGKMTIYNSYLDKSQLIVKGSKFASEGKTFLSQSDVTVLGFTYSILPGGKISINPGTADVSVEAELAGNTYNLEPSNFVITSLSSDKQDTITAKSTAAFTGGVTKEIKVVTEEDLKKAEESLKAELSESAKKELSDKITAEKLIVSEKTITSEVLSSNGTKEANTESDNFDYTVKLKLSNIAFAQKDLTVLLKSLAEKKIGPEKMLINPDGAEVNYEIADGSDNLASYKIKTKLKAKTASKIDPEAIKKQIKNKNIANSKEIIQGNSTVEAVEIKVWPSFVNRIPLLTSRIKVNFDYAK